MEHVPTCPACVAVLLLPLPWGQRDRTEQRALTWHWTTWKPVAHGETPRNFPDNAGARNRWTISSWSAPCCSWDVPHATEHHTTPGCYLDHIQQSRGKSASSDWASPSREEVEEKKKIYQTHTSMMSLLATQRPNVSRKWKQIVPQQLLVKGKNNHLIPASKGHLENEHFSPSLVNQKNQLPPPSQLGLCLLGPTPLVPINTFHPLPSFFSLY